ncbi:Uncharacterized membrane protein YeiB [Roseateles sp. YR242]|uniref:DUF418 domain-containing protein n=1 Tax=Roseateles sp. YR242 TaxID=1855305 RepID=UPI0008B1693B|nr:DUF418 domain-containing protein [Roseateles sp. YR242]SEL69913.1 Uncharacterized membrane protein YeiB [Roseateles sp. YR242]
MTLAASPPQRVAVVDALRAVALLPVVVVNWVGYPALPDGGPLSPPAPMDSALAQVLSWLLHGLIAGKGISLLAFLFGYSQALSQTARSASALEHRRQRLKRMAILGLLHGCLLYMGDILTTYAACGWLMLGWMARTMGELRVRLRVVVALNLLIILLTLVLAQMPISGATSVSLSAPSPWSVWVMRNMGHYLGTMLMVIVLGLPLPLLLMTLGLMAGRLRLFSHPRWRPMLARWVRRWWLPALLLNLVGVSVLWPGLQTGDAYATSRYAIGYLYPTMLLLSVAVPALVMACHQRPAWLALLAPLGRHTLTLYIGSSVLSLLLFSGAGLAWQPGTAVVLALALLYWGGGLILAHKLGSRRLPLEAWMSR